MRYEFEFTVRFQGNDWETTVFIDLETDSKGLALLDKARARAKERYEGIERITGLTMVLKGEVLRDKNRTIASIGLD